MGISSERFAGDLSPCGRSDEGAVTHEYIPGGDGYDWQRQTTCWECGCYEGVQTPCGHANQEERDQRSVRRCAV